jgi:hypothetical protein
VKPRGFAARLWAPDAPLDLEQRKRECRDPDYWRQLAPALGVGQRALAGDGGDAGHEPGAAAELLAAEGWLQAPALVSEERVRGALAAAEAVVAAGWPRVFAFVYDELWRCLRAPSLVALSHSLLGQGARQLPGLWVNHVPAMSGAFGWGPHVDLPGPARLLRPGVPARLTAWLALTAATVENGCLYLVPPRHAGELATRFHELESAAMHDVIRLLHGSRAVPLLPGGLALWRSDVLHWGSFSSGEASAARLAVSFELAHEDAQREPREEPSFGLGDEVPFEHRLALIGRGLLAYGKAKEREPFAHRFVPLADELCDLWL